jgi:hypothetical protein
MSNKAPQEDGNNLREVDGELLEKPLEEVAKGIVDKAKKRLDELHFHPVRNAFVARCIRFGLDPRNIWGANPVDLMCMLFNQAS